MQNFLWVFLKANLYSFFNVLRITSIIATTSIIISIPYSYADTEGDVGKKSTGTLDIGLTIEDMMRFKVLINLDEDTVSSSGDISRQSDTCIYLNTGGKYSIMATTSQGGFKLNKRGNSKKEVGFSAYWSDTAGIKGRKKLNYGIPLTGQTIDHVATKKCLNGLSKGNSNFSIQIMKDNIRKAKIGDYSTTISIIIAPD